MDAANNHIIHWDYFHNVSMIFSHKVLGLKYQGAWGLIGCKEIHL